MTTKEVTETQKNSHGYSEMSPRYLLLLFTFEQNNSCSTKFLTQEMTNQIFTKMKNQILRSLSTRLPLGLLLSID